MRKLALQAECAVAAAIRGQDVVMLFSRAENRERAKRECLAILRHVDELIGLGSNVRYGANIMRINRGRIQFRLPPK